jgi:glycine/D-amino acid oxidase-like deaminating enzyme
MPGGIHCRPEGSSWIKLGWAFNETPSAASWESALEDCFPEVVLRGAARLHPALRAYYGRLPRNMIHYGGSYTMTEENWPLIGPLEVPGAYIAGAMSGFGTMAACAAGEICARWVLGAVPTADEIALSPRRYDDATVMAGLRSGNKGVL